MQNRVGRGLLVLSAVLALLMAGPATTASAETIQTGTSVCSMYVNSIGFGAYCSNGPAYISGGDPPPTWRTRLAGKPFIPCRDFDIPDGIRLPKAPEGKKWVMRITITDYKLDTYDGGDDAHLERAYVPVGPAEEAQCPFPAYMEPFWHDFRSDYPPPALVVMPTFTPRVNVPAFFSLTPKSSKVEADKQTNPGEYSGYIDPRHNLTMRGLVVEMTVDPGDGTKPFKCAMGVTPEDDPDGYDETQDPFHQINTCKHTYERSSANQPDDMYTVKLTITWEVSYWVGKGEGGWQPIGKANVTAVQRLPVQEAQAIGG